MATCTCTHDKNLQKTCGLPVPMQNTTCKQITAPAGVSGSIAAQRGQLDSQSQVGGSGLVPKEGQAPSQRPCTDAKLRYTLVAPKGLSKESQLKKSKDTDQAMESSDSSGPYLTSDTVSLPRKTENIVPEWWNSWQRRNRGNMALLNTPMWIATRLLEEKLTVLIGLL
jgi:hypothetical protein